MKNLEELSIAPFTPKDQVEAKNLILAGMLEHWGVLDPSKNPDLNDIGAAYADGLFLVARDDERIVATGALLPRSNPTAEIARMSVAREMRRKGLGQLMLSRLCEQARARGFQTIVLETTATWTGAIAFYQNAGFRITHTLDGEVYFELDIRPERIEAGRHAWKRLD